MGAILLNGATVAEDCIVAAGSLLTEGYVVPPRSLVMGRPGARHAGRCRTRKSRRSASTPTRYVGYRLDYFTPPAASER